MCAIILSIQDMRICLGIIHLINSVNMKFVKYLPHMVIVHVVHMYIYVESTFDINSFSCCNCMMWVYLTWYKSMKRQSETFDL